MRLYAVSNVTGDNRLTKFRTQQILFAMFVLGALMAVSLNTTVEQQIHSQNTVISDITGKSITCIVAVKHYDT